MTTATAPTLVYAGSPLNQSADALGLLRRSDDARHDAEELRARMAGDGYLFMPGLLNRDAVLAAREAVLLRLEAEGHLDPSRPRMEGALRHGVKMAWRPDLALNNSAVADLLFDGAMMAFFRDFFGTTVRHFDYTWLRAKSPGPDTMTPPHCDVVYMSRGTPNLFTAWTPLGDVPFELGGLMILEGSHRRDDRLGRYWQMDVDSYCSNQPEAEEISSGRQLWSHSKLGGAYGQDAIAVQKALHQRWLTTEYAAGDVLIFGIKTLHASVDNRTDRLRLSTDTRYQRADEPIDERWIGPNPIAHGVPAKKGMIC